MKWADKIDMKLSSPTTGKRLRKLLDEGRLVLAGSAARPVPSGRVVVVADEADAYPSPDHQRVAITTR